MAASYKEETKMAFKEVKIEELSFNPFTKISKEWMLITAGDEEKHNTIQPVGAVLELCGG